MVLISLYFSAYLTGIGALIERLNPPTPDVTTPLIADGFNTTNFTLAANATIETAFDALPGEVSSVAIEVVYWVLLVCYALVPVGFCACFGVSWVEKGLRMIRQITPSGWRYSPSKTKKDHSSPSSHRSKRSTPGAFRRGA